MSGPNSRENRRQALAAARQSQQQRSRRLWLGAIAGGLVILAAAVGITLGVSGGSGSAGSGPGSGNLAPLSALGTLAPAPSPGPLGPENVPIPDAAPLAGLGSAASGQPVSGISCSANEQTVYHIHAHLTIFVSGKPRQVPAGIGIPGAQVQNTPAGPFVAAGTCFYWLHTHAADGIIHIESPTQTSYTLGQFFDVWGQSLSRTQVGPAAGRVTAIVNGKVYTGNPRDIRLTARASIQLQVGTPLVEPQTIDWQSTGL